MAGDADYVPAVHKVTPRMSRPAHRDLVAAARKLRPQIRAAQAELDDARRLPPSLVEALSETGVFRAFYPSALGGLQADPHTLYRAIEAIACVDGTVGWCAMVTGVFGIVAGWLRDEVALELFGPDADVRIAGSFQPTGKARRVEGGFRIGGRWTFASGIDYANWIFCTCVVEDEPNVRGMLVPVEQVAVLDTWRVLGMRATGSHDFTVQDQFVPAERSICFKEASLAEGALYADHHFLLPLAWVPVAAVPMGIARGSMNLFKELAGKSGSNLSATLLRDRQPVQLATARAEGIIDSSRAYLLEATQRAYQALEAGAHEPLQELAHLSLATAQACHEAVRAVEILFEAAGTNAIYDDNRLERSLRDVRVAGTHRAGHQANVELAGQILLGLRPPGW